MFQDTLGKNRDAVPLENQPTGQELRKGFYDCF